MDCPNGWRQAAPTIPGWMAAGVDHAALSLWTRFLFSALVDADFLDTERFYAGGIGRDLGARPELRALRGRRLDRYLDQKSAGAANIDERNAVASPRGVQGGCAIRARRIHAHGSYRRRKDAGVASRWWKFGFKKVGACNCSNSLYEYH